VVAGRNVLEWRADPTSGYGDAALTERRGDLIVMCAEGYSSSLAAASLQDVGLTDATDMVGGFLAWRAAGLPVEPCPD
jgi:rhodanese-related sulfurtransferase